tara:strand:+ start:94 stop:432 length:339 start_codon:yes stop_codon:yes gene_type:complete
MNRKEGEIFIKSFLEDPENEKTKADICNALKNDFNVPNNTAYLWFKAVSEQLDWEQPQKTDPRQASREEDNEILDHIRMCLERAIKEKDDEKIVKFSRNLLAAKKMTRSLSY